ncbi:MAG: chromate transporter [Treponemataceae bacterium]|nr:chromate transporter [Treponemataceae bacterium]
MTISLLELAAVFFYIGLFTIGGGQVAITLMYDPVVGRGLLSAEEFAAMLAVSESTPGPIGVNMATYIGVSQYGILGGIVITAATILPSLIIILIIAAFFEHYQEKPLVQNIFTAVRPVSVALIAVAAWNVLSISIASPALFTWQRLAIFLTAFCLFLKTKISPIFIMILGAIGGMILL